MKAVKALIEAGKVEEAIVLLEQMKDARPEDDSVRYELGNAYWKKQDWKPPQQRRSSLPGRMDAGRWPI